MKKILFFFICALFTRNGVAADDLSLIDLFGEEETKTSETQQEPSPIQQDKVDSNVIANTEQISKDEQKSKLSEFFSFLNIPFFRTKDTSNQPKLARKDNEAQESYETRIIKMAENDVNVIYGLGYSKYIHQKD